MKILGAPQRLVVAASQSRQAAGDLQVDVVADGFVPLIRRCDVDTYDRADTQPFAGWKAGVYDRQRRVCESSLLDRHWTRVTVPFWPRELDLGDIRWRRGSAMYGGLLFHHFGRFLLETTNRLWWCLAEQFKGPIVFQNTRPRHGIPDFARRFFSLLGLADQILVADKPLGYDRIYVPHRSYVGQRTFHPQFRIPFTTAGEAAENLSDASDEASEAGARGVYLSRTRMANRSSRGEQLIEEKLGTLGFAIAHTQEMPLEAQIRLIRRHRHIVGIAGSAFHNILFSRDSVISIYICKDYDINSNFFMIDELMNNDGTYLYSGSADDAETPRSARELMDDHWDDVTLNTEKIISCLGETWAMA